MNLHPTRGGVTLPLPDTDQADSAVVFDPVANLGPGEVLFEKPGNPDASGKWGVRFTAITFNPITGGILTERFLEAGNERP